MLSVPLAELDDKAPAVGVDGAFGSVRLPLRTSLRHRRTMPRLNRDRPYWTEGTHKRSLGLGNHFVHSLT